MRALLEFDVEAVAECWPNAAKDSERLPLVLARGDRNCEILVFRVPGALLNQLCVESSPAIDVNNNNSYLLVTVEYRHIVFNHGMEADGKFSPHLFQDVRWVPGGAKRSLSELVLDAVHLVHVGNAFG